MNAKLLCTAHATHTHKHARAHAHSTTQLALTELVPLAEASRGEKLC